MRAGVVRSSTPADTPVAHCRLAAGDHMDLPPQAASAESLLLISLHESTDIRTCTDWPRACFSWSAEHIRTSQ